MGAFLVHWPIPGFYDIITGFWVHRGQKNHIPGDLIKLLFWRLWVPTAGSLEEEGEEYLQEVRRGSETEVPKPLTPSFKKKSLDLFILFLCVCMFCLDICMSTTRFLVPKEIWNGVIFHVSTVTGGCEPYERAENWLNLGLLKQHQVFLIAGSFL